LKPRQALLQNDAAKQNIGQRIEIVTEASGEDVPAIHRIDVEQPVSADEQSGDGQQDHHAAVAERLAHFAPCTGNGEQGREDRDRPDDPVSDDVGRVDRPQGLEVDGKDAPQAISGDAQRQPFASTSIDVGSGLAIHHSRAYRR
jgi:hypothetical protein